MDYCSGCCDGVPAYADAGEDDSRGANPGALFYEHRLAGQHRALVRIVVVGNDGGVGSNFDIVFDGDF